MGLLGVLRPDHHDLRALFALFLNVIVGLDHKPAAGLLGAALDSHRQAGGSRGYGEHSAVVCVDRANSGECGAIISTGALDRSIHRSDHLGLSVGIDHSDVPLRLVLEVDLRDRLFGPGDDHDERLALDRRVVLRQRNQRMVAFHEDRVADIWRLVAKDRVAGEDVGVDAGRARLMPAEAFGYLCKLQRLYAEEHRTLCLADAHGILAGLDSDAVDGCGGYGTVGDVRCRGEADNAGVCGAPYPADGAPPCAAVEADLNEAVGIVVNAYAAGLLARQTRSGQEEYETRDDYCSSIHISDYSKISPKYD